MLARLHVVDAVYVRRRRRRPIGSASRGLSGKIRLALDIDQVSLFDPTTEWWR
jgi:hypothetical protein